MSTSGLKSIKAIPKLMLADRLTQVKLKYSVCTVLTFIHMSDVSVCVDGGRFQTGQIT